MDRCEGSIFQVSSDTQQMGVKSAKEVEDEGKKEERASSSPSSRADANFSGKNLASILY